MDESQIEYGNFKTSGRQCRALESANETLLRITLSHEQIISWIRVEVVDESKAPTAVFRLKKKDKMQPCNPEKRLVNGPIVDILCDNKENKGAREVEVQAFVNSTCSVFISQGWDVSLKQPATLSSQFEHRVASFAVDGDNGTFADCEIELDKSWWVSFNFPTEITYFFIVNRWDSCCNHRIKSSSILYLDEGGQSHYITRLKDEVARNYNGFTPLNFTGSWRGFKIQKITKVIQGLNIAEVSVYGKQQCPKGTYGLGCKKKCTHCLPQSGCFVTGACYFCPGDYFGPKCDKQCPAGLSGSFCERVCHEGCEGKRCSAVDGSCLHGCADGWQGPGCLETCPSGTWGKKCSESCSEKCSGNGNECSPVDGSCIHGCDPGFTGENCASECPAGTFGLNCSSNCSKNCDADPSMPCDRKTGRCHKSSGCKAGWYGPDCLETCRVGTWGENCAESCSENCGGNGNECSAVDGSCIHGCTSGFTGKNCASECPAGTFGLKCSSKCPKNCDAMPCDKNTGRCHACKAGWQGPSCLETCPLGTWGKNCNESCSENCGGNGTCFQTNGSCLESCLSGYIKPLCLEKLVESESEGSNFWWWLILLVLVILAATLFLLFTAKKGNNARKSSQEGAKKQ